MSTRTPSRPADAPEATPPAAASSAPAPDDPFEFWNIIRRDWRWVLLLLVGVAIAYIPAYTSTTVWDDQSWTQNPLLRDLEGLRMIWTWKGTEAIPNEEHFWPLTYTSFWVEYQLWGLRPMGYHCTNVALLAINGVLVGVAARMLRLRGAWVIALLWALHPTKVESTAWVIERKDLLSGALFWGAFVAYFRHHATRAPGVFWGGVALFALSLLAKTSTVTLPAALALAVLWREGRLTGRDAMRILPFALVGGVMVAAELSYNATRNQMVSPYGLLERIGIAGSAVWFYAGKVLWPWPLIPVYPKWETTGAPGVAMAAGAWAGLLGATGLALHRRGAWGWGPFAALGWFVAVLSPTLGVIAFSYQDHSFVADRFLFNASAAPLAAAVHAASMWVGRRGATDAKGGAHTSFSLYNNISIYLSAGCMLLYAGLSFQHARNYKNMESLFKHTIAHNRESWGAWVNLGFAKMTGGELADSISYFQEALRLRPETFHAQHNWGLVLLGLGRFEEAEERFKEALKLQPNFELTRHAYGFLLELEGRTEEARAMYSDGIHGTRAQSGVVSSMAQILGQGKNVWLAIEQYRRALELDPENMPAHLGIANLLVRVGRWDEAVQHYRIAVTVFPAFTDGLNNLAWILATHPDAKVRNGEEARFLAIASCARRGWNDATTLDTLAAAHAECGDFDLAVQHAEKALAAGRRQNAKVLVARIERRLELYRQRKPFRDPLPLNPPPVVDERERIARAWRADAQSLRAARERGRGTQAASETTATLQQWDGKGEPPASVRHPRTLLFPPADSSGGAQLLPLATPAATAPQTGTPKATP